MRKFYLLLTLTAAALSLSGQSFYHNEHVKWFFGSGLQRGFAGHTKKDAGYISGGVLVSLQPNDVDDSCPLYLVPSAGAAFPINRQKNNANTYFIGCSVKKYLSFHNYKQRISFSLGGQVAMEEIKPPKQLIFATAEAGYSPFSAIEIVIKGSKSWQKLSQPYSTCVPAQYLAIGFNFYLEKDWWFSPNKID